MEHSFYPQYRGTYIQVDLDAVAHNVRLLKKETAKDRHMLAVVKANAYGHGIVQVARVALENGADYLGVAIPEEKYSVYTSSVMGQGPEISLSVLTDASLTKKLIECADKNSIPYQLTVDGTNTGTNANDIPTVGEGIKTVLFSIPLMNMHTYAEIISLDDVSYTSSLLCHFIKELAETEAER